MEKQSLKVNDGTQHHESIQILDITNHLHTLIKVGYAEHPRSPTLSQTKFVTRKNIKFGSRRVSASRKSIMNEETIWRRWRAKMQCNEILKRSRNFSNSDIDDPRQFDGSAKKPKMGYSFGEIEGTILNNSMRNRHIKNIPSVNAMGYHGMYNGIMAAQITPKQLRSMPIYNDHNRKKIEDESYHVRIKSNMRGTFKDYCNHCTIHGLKYVGDTNLPNFERIFWILSFVVAICGAAYFIWLLYAKFLLSPIIISRSPETVSIEQFPFPALTVCNMNNAKKSVARQIVRGNDTLQKVFLDDICNTKSGINFTKIPEVSEESGNWDNIYSFLLNVSQRCAKMLYYCEWRGNPMNCTEIFNPVLTDEGLCCKFNSVPQVLYDPRVWENLEISYASDKHIDWNPEYKYTDKDSPNAIPWRAYGSGSNNGLTLALDVDSEEYYCSSTASVGFKMLLHSPVETPQIADFAFTLSPGKETRVIITPHITDADISIMKIAPKIRHCYFLSERKLRYYRTYTQRNCVLECEANFTLKYCKCMQYYMPVSNDTRICGKDDDSCAVRARDFMKTKLFEEDDPKSTFNLTEAPSCKCYPGCNEINYSTEISQSMLMATFEIPEEYLKYNDSYFEKNIAVVHIFFIDSSYMKYVKNELYGFPELLSNTGGLLGLFMGFSLLSVTEIFYYFTIRLWWRLWKHRAIKNDKNRFIVQTLTKDMMQYTHLLNKHRSE